MSKSKKQIGEYYKKNTCRFCRSNQLEEILDFGNVPLAGGFIEQKYIVNEKYYPLTINFCRNCYLVQVGSVVSVEILFKEKYFFYSSAINTLVEHFNKFADEIYNTFLKDKKEPSVLEIGCNDGVLLRPLSFLGVDTIGVDPASNVIKNIGSDNIKVYNDCFTEKLAIRIREKHGKVDSVLSCYSFAHIDDMIDVMNGISNILKDDGIFIFEVYYLGTLIEEMQYDNFYHEHMSYYSIETLGLFLKKFDMEIFDIKYLPNVRTGSTRFYARYIGKRTENISLRFKKMLADERQKGFNDLSVLKKYSGRVKNTKKELISTLEDIKNQGKTIIGYGASGRGTTIMNYCGIDGKYLDYVVDDAPAKHGFYTPGTHLPIKSWAHISKNNVPDYIVLFAWAFADEVVKKRKNYIQKGGKFIIPLPEVKIIEK